MTESNVGLCSTHIYITRLHYLSLYNRSEALTFCERRCSPINGHIKEIAFALMIFIVLQSFVISANSFFNSFIFIFCNGILSHYPRHGNSFLFSSDNGFLSPYQGTVIHFFSRPIMDFCRIIQGTEIRYFSHQTMDCCSLYQARKFISFEYYNICYFPF
jgi:hypothetical protein